MNRRFDLDKEIKAKSIEKAAEKFAKVLINKGYDWAGEEIVESVNNGYICCSNAMQHPIAKGKVSNPKTNDWSFYWAIENLYDDMYYAWFIER